MGQKVNPISNRLGIIRGWDSNWYGGRNYGDSLLEDSKIRKYLNARLSKASVSRIVIERTLKLVTITVCTARPGVIIGKGGETVDRLKEELKKITDKDIQINIFEVKRPELDAVIVATGKDVLFPLMKKLKDRGEFVVSETTFLSLDDSEMEELYDMKGACAEQYMYTPLYASILKGCELVGNIDQLYLSGLHNHHAASIARIVLGLGDSMPEKISSMDFPSRVVKTGERKGMVADGVDEEYSRKLRVLSFGDKLFIILSMHFFLLSSFGCTYKFNVIEILL